MKSLFPCAMAVAMACLPCTQADAATEIWHLQNTVLSNGVAVTGSFAFDPTANSYSNINLKVGTTTFSMPNPASPGNASVMLAVDGVHSNYTGSPLVVMNWNSALTAQGGTVGLSTTGNSFLGSCTSASCSSINSSFNFISGSVTTSETWYLQNAVLSNGLTLTGSFAYDPVSGSYSNINITAGSTHFGIPNPSSPGNSVVLIAVDGLRSNYTGTPLLAMNWASALPATGGTMNLNTSGFTFLGTCGDSNCMAVGTPTMFVSGSVTTTAPVPEPTSLALILGGLGLVGRVARTRARQESALA